MTSTIRDRRRRADDSGFTLVEVLVSLGIIGLVMSSLGFFIIRSMTVTSQQGDRQTAAQLAADGMERVREVPAAAAITEINKMNASDPAGEARRPIRDGVTYTRSWVQVSYSDPALRNAPFIQVTVTVTWQGNCAGGCRYSTMTLVSIADSEPVFNTETS
jgi:prepilin-type N-terminal cleavage/methylation domain-containing protein